MRSLIYTFIFLSLIGIGDLTATDSNLDRLNEQDQISFYRGYLLWQESLQRPGMPYNFEQVLAGMRAAENGENLSFNDDQLHERTRRFQEDLLTKQTVENLADAEEFLAKIAKDEIFELIPKKLYFTRLKAGQGQSVQEDGIPLLRYTVWTYNRWGKTEVISIDSPLPVMLQDVIPGFAKGVQGMLEGEVRKLFIHPDLAYGTYGKFDPNLLVIFEVEIIAAHCKVDDFN